MPAGHSAGCQQTTDTILNITAIIIITAVIQFGDKGVERTLVRPLDVSGRSNRLLTPKRKQIVTFFIKYYSGSKSTKYLLPAM